MFVKFDVTKVTKEANPQTFEAGECYDMPAASGFRWIKRNVAHEISEAEYKEHKAAARSKSKRTKPPAAEGAGAPDPTKTGGAGEGAGAGGGGAGGNG